MSEHNNNEMTQGKNLRHVSKGKNDSNLWTRKVADKRMYENNE